MPGIVHEIDALTPHTSHFIILGTELRLLNDLVSAVRHSVGRATRGTDTGGPEVRPATFARINVARMQAGVTLRVGRCVVQ